MAGYAGEPIAPREIISSPPHSLAVQSWKPREMQSGTVNADGFGAALWLDDGAAEPALYRTGAPVWADPNLPLINDRLRARSLIAAVRSATPGIGFELANVQPFVHGHWAFAHNGFVAGFRQGPQRAIRDSLGREAYESIQGSSDSEHVFALVIDGLAEGPLVALRKALLRLGAICREQDRACVVTALLGDGAELYGVRWAWKAAPATLYLSKARGLRMASEPLEHRELWQEIPPGRIVAGDGRSEAVE